MKTGVVIITLLILKVNFDKIDLILINTIHSTNNVHLVFPFHMICSSYLKKDNNISKNALLDLLLLCHCFNFPGVFFLLENFMLWIPPGRRGPGRHPSSNCVWGVFLIFMENHCLREDANSIEGA